MPTNSRIEKKAVLHAEALLDSPKVKLTGYRVQLIIALLKQEHQRKELQEAAKQRKHEVLVLKLKSEIAKVQQEGEPADPSKFQAVAAAKDFLARINGGERQ